MGTRNSKTLNSMTGENSFRSEDGEDLRLLPGLPDEIILDQIVPKLRWKTFHILSSVSCRWREAIQSRDVYDARVRSHSTEKLLIFNHSVHNGEGEDQQVSLYSVRDDSWRQLPEFPKASESQKGFPIGCQFISLDGKIYVLRGVVTSYGPVVHSEVYVLDVVGQREWKQCAKLLQPRYAFGCGAVDGKIYVLGGLTGDGNPARDSMVYDPKANVWSWIRPVKYMRRYHLVVTVGEELFVHGGHFLHPDNNANNPLPFKERDASATVEVYHAGKDEWRLLDMSLELSTFDGSARLALSCGVCSKSTALFTAQGKLYVTIPLGIYRHDIDSDGNYIWTCLHSFSFGDDHNPIYDFTVEGAQVVDNELLRLMTTYDSNNDIQIFLSESIGFCSKKKEIAWHKIESEILQDSVFDLFMSSIQL